MNTMCFTKVEPANLVDGETYLVSMKHGLIEGCWNQKEECFEGYYWTDLSFNGTAYVFSGLFNEPESVSSGSESL